jgi:hypothetical protein
MTAPEPDGLDAALLMITSLGERLRFAEAALQAQADTLAGLTGLPASVAALAADLAPLLPPAPPPGGHPITVALRWDALTPEERDLTLARLRKWVGRTFRPGAGHLAGKLGDCWESHPLCLVLLDWLSELHSVLYLKPGRTAADLAGQAELWTRLLPAAADLFAAETGSCEHAVERLRTSVNGSGRPWTPR